MKTIASQQGDAILQLLLIASSLCYAVGLPPPHDPPDFSKGCVSDKKEGCFEAQHRVKRAAGNTGGFKYFYVTQCDILTEKPTGIPFVEVAATNRTQDAAHRQAAKMIYLMLRFMPSEFLKRLSGKPAVGVFAIDEVIGDYPEYANTKDTEACKKKNKDKCGGNCKHTCSSDGRKYDSLLGYSKERAVVREDNVMCSGTDPLNGRLNVLTHEFAHTIHLYVLGVDFKRHPWLERSFANRYKVWDRGYATSDQKEYFAEATTSYFRTSLLGPQSAGMNMCESGKDRKLCPDEFSSRENLKSKDPLLYKLVDEMYSGERSYLQGRIDVCGTT